MPPDAPTCCMLTHALVTWPLQIFWLQPLYSSPLFGVTKHNCTWMKYTLHYLLFQQLMVTIPAICWHIQLILHALWQQHISHAYVNNMHIPRQRTPASSLWEQFARCAYLQSISRLSDPEQEMLSRWIGPLPCPKKDVEKATVPVERKLKCFTKVMCESYLKFGSVVCANITQHYVVLIPAVVNPSCLQAIRASTDLQ